MLSMSPACQASTHRVTSSCTALPPIVRSTLCWDRADPIAARARCIGLFTEALEVSSRAATSAAE